MRAVTARIRGNGPVGARRYPTWYSPLLRSLIANKRGKEVMMMAGALPKVRRKRGIPAGTVAVLVGAILVLSGLLVYLLVASPAFNDEPSSDAERDYQLLVQGAQDNPDDPSVLMSLAEVEFELDKRGDAMEHAARAVELAEDEPNYRLRYATLLVRNEQQAQAAKQLQAEISLTGGQDAEPFFLLGQVQADLDQLDAATESLARGLKLDPMAADIRIIYASLLAQQGEKDAAIAQYNEALKFLPGDERGVDGLAALGVTWEASSSASPHGGSPVGDEQ